MGNLYFLNDITIFMEEQKFIKNCYLEIFIKVLYQEMRLFFIN